MLKIGDKIKDNGNIEIIDGICVNVLKNMIDYYSIELEITVESGKSYYYEITSFHNSDIEQLKKDILDIAEDELEKVGE